MYSGIRSQSGKFQFAVDNEQCGLGCTGVSGSDDDLQNLSGINEWSFYDVHGSDEGLHDKLSQISQIDMDQGQFSSRATVWIGEF